MASVDQTYSIYGLVDPRDYSIRYIGLSIHPLTRYQQHLSHSLRTLREWVVALEHVHLRPSLCILQSALPTLKAARLAESRWIHIHRRTTLNQQRHCRFTPRRVRHLTRLRPTTEEWEATRERIGLNERVCVPRSQRRQNESLSDSGLDLDGSTVCETSPLSV